MRPQGCSCNHPSACYFLPLQCWPFLLLPCTGLGLWQAELGVHWQFPGPVPTRAFLTFLLARRRKIAVFLGLRIKHRAVCVPGCATPPARYGVVCEL